MDRLIAEVEGNIQRGFGYRTVTFQTMEWYDCTRPAVAGQPTPAPQRCAIPVTDTRREAVALDMTVERRKLADLKAKKAELDRAAIPATAECRAKFPEYGSGRSAGDRLARLDQAKDRVATQLLYLGEQALQDRQIRQLTVGHHPQPPAR